MLRLLNYDKQLGYLPNTPAHPKCYLEPVLKTGFLGAMPNKRPDENDNVDMEAVSRVAAQLVYVYGKSSCQDAVIRARRQEDESVVKPYARAVRIEVERICAEREKIFPQKK